MGVHRAGQDAAEACYRVVDATYERLRIPDSRERQFVAEPGQDEHHHHPARCQSNPRQPTTDRVTAP